MSMPIVYIDRSDIHEGKLEDVKAGMDELTEFVKAHVPQLIAYGFYLDEAESEMTVVAIHPDSASLEFHLETGASAFRKMGEFIKVRTIEVYGRPSDKVLGQLHGKAETLGEGEARVLIHDHHAGFSRLPSGVT